MMVTIRNSVLRCVFCAAFAVMFGSIPTIASGEVNPQEEFVLADFNSVKAPNNAGDNFGAWSREFNDETQFTDMTFVPDDSKGNLGGHSIRLDYDVDSPTQAYNGFWMTLGKDDFTSYSILNLYVKGDKKAGFTKKVKIEFKDSNNRPSAAYFMVTKITDQWQKISVPFDRFQGKNDWKNLRQFVIVFDDVDSQPKVGSVLIDQISITKI